MTASVCFTLWWLYCLRGNRVRVGVEEGEEGRRVGRG